MFAHPGKKLLFMGGELGEWNEWREDTGLDWMLLDFPAHRGIQRLCQDLNRFYASEPALHEMDFDGPGFEWLDSQDGDASVLSFLRRARDAEQFLVCVCNFTPVVRHNYRVGVPERGFYREVFNSDSAYYEGANTGNAGGVEAEPVPWNGREYSLQLTLGALAAMYFKLDRGASR